MPEENHLRKQSLIALSALFLLLVGAVIYWQARVLFADSAFQVFNVINQQAFSIAHYRYGAFVSQLGPYIFSQMHLPLKVVLFIYAITPNLLFAAVCAIILFVLRQYKVAVLMGLYYLLLVSDSYVLVADEMNQGAAWMFLYFALLLHSGRKPPNPFFLYPTLAILAFLAISSHFILIIPIAFIWGYFLIDGVEWQRSKSASVLLTLLLVTIVAIKMIIGASDPYDNEHLHNVTHFSLQDIAESFAKPVIITFLSRCFTNYWSAMIVFVLGVGSLWRMGKKALAGWTILTCTGYLILMGLAYGEYDEHMLLFHIEIEWRCLSVILATPFVFAFLPSISVSRSSMLLMAIFVVRLSYIGHAMDKYDSRIEFERNILAKMTNTGISKVAIYEETRLKEKYILSWAIPYETMMLSAMNNDQPNKTVLFINPDNKEEQNCIKDPQYLYLFDCVPAKQINTHYFSVDTMRPYSTMHYRDIME
ncbi:MAG: hypothetical protein KF744_03160 [Taibaiella sp.]|nr:hypothetical protein [Taibaiella sp.]